MNNEQLRAQRALDVQSACNVSGVAHSLADLCSEVLQETRSTGALRSDPAIRLYVAKLADLCGLEYAYPLESDAACAEIAAGGGL